MIVERILGRLVEALVVEGHLEFELPGGRRFVAGDGGAPRVRARLTDRAAGRELVLDPELKFGELFMDGRLVVEEGTVYDLLALLLQAHRGDRGKLPGRALTRIRRLLRRLTARNPLERSRRNVAHHYDIDGRVYDLFLDADRQYSCAYYERPDATLEEAQLAKKRHVTAKLLVEPGHSVLDIGCGWGGLALYLAEIAGAGAVRGVTLSEEQLAVARGRAADAGLDRVTFALEDYRRTEGRYDRIVSVGMFEHVGPAHYEEYFAAAARLLADDGVMLLHTIGRTGEPDFTNPWMTRYIFPGGHLPTLSEMLPVIERSGLAVTDVEVLRLHYAETLREWRNRFMARREEAKALMDERFCRMWECYLAMSEAAFRFEDVVVFQIQLAKRNDVVPLTRDHVGEREARLRAAEAARQAANDRSASRRGLAAE
ncbi:SAM-dependent methyltransferase [Oharaeibacter diazotrophicus]|uniref:Cyclopropane-fatty-acyl-phospholipid synthase n=1 Tax=Oharaeibacter diazotrophicus TaxID=1920512 RepID=A0A4V3CV92_9HYPH|nr:cyclopropane-fatty-acyl-phospholipid synthase family protein [Oharaeibacter diazotrophicus]TDP81528.1 cyclopropane-fatty-acyl-phospholipid synthase [Oharaeibacter diazotrophicus]BBE73766.1 cyclopropane-fatty-acyl-phospholipid synthase [Pleomorphomonas sp. SM30]GLS75557.1 replicative DNA helicase [Oharaeibacter diazotrophicus]